VAAGPSCAFGPWITACMVMYHCQRFSEFDTHLCFSPRFFSMCVLGETKDLTCSHQRSSRRLLPCQFNLDATLPFLLTPDCYVLVNHVCVAPRSHLPRILGVNSSKQSVHYHQLLPDPASLNGIHRRDLRPSQEVISPAESFRLLTSGFTVNSTLKDSLPDGKMQAMQSIKCQSLTISSTVSC